MIQKCRRTRWICCINGRQAKGSTIMAPSMVRQNDRPSGGTSSRNPRTTTVLAAQHSIATVTAR